MYHLDALGLSCIIQDLSQIVVVVQGLRCRTACGNLVPSYYFPSLLVLCIEDQILNHWATKKFPAYNMYNCHSTGAHSWVTPCCKPQAPQNRCFYFT